MLHEVLDIWPRPSGLRLLGREVRQDAVKEQPVIIALYEVLWAYEAHK